MKLTFNLNQQAFLADFAAARSIAISLQPNQAQPSHFGAPAATATPLVAGSFVGDTRQGGSCNVQQLVIVPHCNGTHTESVAHIVNQPLPVYQALTESVFVCALISLNPVKAQHCSESYLPGFDPDNRVITAAAIEQAIAQVIEETIGQLNFAHINGLVIRTLPNQSNKKTQQYDQQHYPIYLTLDAIHWLVDQQIQHLLVDFPSIDKMYDQGMLNNHHVFWQVEAGSRELNPDSRRHATVTEMVFVENEISDGVYLCNLQIPSIDTDAVPSRPMLIPLAPIN